jgi:RNA polymerase sigma-70 factor (ECF subfamily)
VSIDEKQRHSRFLRSFTAHEPAIRAYIRRLVPLRTDADDVLQDVAVVLWEKFDTFRPGEDFRAWAFGVARFEVLGWLRDRGRNRLVLDDAVVEQIAAEAAAAEPHLERQREALEKCLERVGAAERNLLISAYRPESRIQEVAAGSGRSEAGFYQWLHRMRRSLLDCIRARLAQEAWS